MAGLLAYSISGAFPSRVLGTVAKCLKFKGDYSCGYSSGIAPDSLFSLLLMNQFSAAKLIFISAFFYKLGFIDIHKKLFYKL
jgi:hypothetical protein